MGLMGVTPVTFDQNFFMNSIADLLAISEHNLEYRSVVKRQSETTATVQFRIFDGAGVDSASEGHELENFYNSNRTAFYSYPLYPNSLDIDYSLAANPGEESGSNKSESSMIIIAIAVPVGATAIVGLIIAVVVAKRKKRNLSDDESQVNKDVEMPESPPSRPESIHKGQDSEEPENKRASHRKTDRWNIDYTTLIVDKELGRGAFGVVFLAKWRNSPCVVKQLENNASADSFLKEATNVKYLRPHPNICQILGVCADPKYPLCIVMEFVYHGNLWGMIMDKKITIDTNLLLDFAIDIASGMNHLHSENIIHCDLACRNLLVAPKEGNGYLIKITDFGLSRVTEADVYNADKNAVFPVRWTAPETIRGRIVSKPMDVWSYGITLWEMAEGKQPYPDKSNPQVVAAVCDQGYRLEKPLIMPEKLYEILQYCWKEDPKERPSFEEICEQLAVVEKLVRGSISWEKYDDKTKTGLQQKEEKNKQSTSTSNDSTYGNSGNGLQVRELPSEDLSVAVYGNGNIRQPKQNEVYDAVSEQ